MKLLRPENVRSIIDAQSRQLFEDDHVTTRPSPVRAVALFNRTFNSVSQSNKSLQRFISPTDKTAEVKVNTSKNIQVVTTNSVRDGLLLVGII